ncbi:MAG: four helix bundle protein [Deltaproteobacteria bacterium]|nr:four helix bundle protein [Deltaproteobacteria bacterium]MBW2199992.1 four helix bundle protein [Deltaproteobacteria bacterium]MBW2538043.1 four helix bundle protein [Deltaproteobacteria bacterium]
MEQKGSEHRGYQIIRSSDSLSANIAEGYGWYAPADRKKFYLNQMLRNTKQ